jgi:hypothetical protein
LTLAQTFGLPIALLVIAIVTGRQAVWVWGRELIASEARNAALAADYEERLKAQREAHLQREADLAAKAEQWQKYFFEMLGPITSLAEVIGRRSTEGPPP